MAKTRSGTSRILSLVLLCALCSAAHAQGPELELDARRLGNQLLQAMDQARHGGVTTRVACLDRTLTELNALRRNLRADRGRGRLAHHARQLERLREQAQGCVRASVSARKDGTRVVAIIPDEPEHEPYWER